MLEAISDAETTRELREKERKRKEEEEWALQAKLAVSLISVSTMYYYKLYLDCLTVTDNFYEECLNTSIRMGEKKLIHDSGFFEGLSNKSMVQIYPKKTSKKCSLHKKGWCNTGSYTSEINRSCDKVPYFASKK